MNHTFKHIIYLITLTLLGLNSYANNLDEQNSTICLSVGLYASIIDLDDITLTNYTGISGNRNTEYHGNDQFTVKSNGPVRIFVSGDAMTHKITNTVLPTDFKLENDLNYFDTQANQAHLGEHTVNVKAITTEISNSPAGQYEGTVVVTVTPQIEKYLSNYNCTLRQASYPVNSSYATIAFEDLYPRPGDADYNDMVVNLRMAILAIYVELEYISYNSNILFGVYSYEKIKI
ncbi:DUF4114 domain-containing protein [Thiotrichales bacterium 19X7-9]|nr:DUF4114 domain-containing protein [Thiotrichales bacterium 19X7-9]